MANESPDWIRAAILQTLQEAQRYLETVWRFTTRPGRFAREWAEGGLVALNPLGMLATSAGLVGTVQNLLQRFVNKAGEDESLLHSIASAGAPFVHYLFLGCVCHVLMGPRRKLRDSLALALFAGAGPAVWTEIASYFAGVLLWVGAGKPRVAEGGLMRALPHGMSNALAALAVCGLCAFGVSFALAMAGLHRASLGRVAFSLVVALLAAGFIFGLPGLDLAFGPRLSIHLHPLHLDLWID
jgi:hypothetical protein